MKNIFKKSLIVIFAMASIFMITLNGMAYEPSTYYYGGCVNIVNNTSKDALFQFKMWYPSSPTTITSQSILNNFTNTYYAYVPANQSIVYNIHCYEGWSSACDISIFLGRNQILEESAFYVGHDDNLYFENQADGGIGILDKDLSLASGYQLSAGGGNGVAISSGQFCSCTLQLLTIQ